MTGVLFNKLDRSILAATDDDTGKYLLKTR